MPRFTWADQPTDGRAGDGEMMEKLKTINIDERIALEITLCPNPPWYGSVHPPTMPLMETPNSQMFLV